MFSELFLKSFRILLFPFALLYGLGVFVRNLLFDLRVFRSTSFALPIICVGNLSVGGTGKSPMVEFLVSKLKQEFRVAILSRGYKRRTRGYSLARESSTALDIGDEPMQFHLKFPDIPVAVGERRIEAIPQLLHDRPETEVVILDDGFQHREIRAGLNILLTEYGNLYAHDFFLPTGDLRDQKNSSRRADIIVVTKCTESLSFQEREKLLMDLRALPQQQVFFTGLAYGQPYHIITRQPGVVPEDGELLLVAGIANPKMLKRYLEQRTGEYHMIQFPDHHIYTVEDLNAIRRRFGNLEKSARVLLTTEKDAVRLLKFRNELQELPLYVLPVRHYFLFNQEQQFLEIVRNFITQFKKPEPNGKKELEKTAATAETGNR